MHLNGLNILVFRAKSYFFVSSKNLFAFSHHCKVKIPIFHVSSLHWKRPKKNSLESSLVTIALILSFVTRYENWETRKNTFLCVKAKFYWWTHLHLTESSVLFDKFLSWSILSENCHFSQIFSGHLTKYSR